jgi:hypothetical protein
MLAAVLETGRLERLYSALSLLASTAAHGTPARALAGFGALPVLLLEPVELAARARESGVRSGRRGARRRHGRGRAAAGGRRVDAALSGRCAGRRPAVRMTRRLGATVALAATVAAGAGCGVESPDLFVLHRTGRIPGARLALLVNDGGTVRCNGAKARELPSPLLLSARALTPKLTSDASAHRSYPPRPGSVLAYSVRSQHGTVAWADTSRPLPERYLRLAFLARQIAQRVCGLPR